MARLEHISHVEHRCEMINDKVVYTPHPYARSTKLLPQIFWTDQTPWQEANLWAHDRARTRDVDMQTVVANLRGLAHYATFLESRALQWFEFPAIKADRCIVQYRGFLKDAMSNGDLSPSTASARMRYVIAFYRWVQIEGIFTPANQMWRDKPVYIKYFDAVGFERSMLRISTDLSIPNRARPGERLEDGLLPVSANDRDCILNFAMKNASQEFFLLLSAGFFTGMRLGTLCDLKIKTLEHAVPDPAASGMFLLSVGPGASIPVHTKFGVTGQVWITRELREALLEYAYSPRRLFREALATPENRQLLFLTRYGNSYSRRNTDNSCAINVEMSGFRKAGVVSGLKVLSRFHFHQSRCTFATELATLAIKVGDDISAIAFVRDALLHKNEATALKYVKFAKKKPVMQSAANAFSTAFLGIMTRTKPPNND